MSVANSQTDIEFYICKDFKAHGLLYITLKVI